MDKAKAAVGDFLKKAGHHDTTVDQSVAPAVTHETVSPTRDEHVTTAIDKEVHQDHHHTSVQNVVDREVLPEQHTHQQAAVQTRSVEHGTKEETERRLADEAAQFKSQRVVGNTAETKTVEPTVAGEHVHHHVHETIQPVVHKETIQPHVVHTTAPVHEIHHNAPQHHATTELPTVSMAEFKKSGPTVGSTTGSDGYTTGSHGTTGTTGTTGTSGLTNTSDSTGTTGTHKPSMMDKLNPKVDADGDGKAGFMK